MSGRFLSLAEILGESRERRAARTAETRAARERARRKAERARALESIAGPLLALALASVIGAAMAAGFLLQMPH